MRGFGLIVLAAFLAAGAGGVAFLYLKAKAASADSPATTQPVVVAAEDMTFGTRLEDRHLKLVEFPKDAVPQGAYAEVDSVLGQTTKVFLVRGEPVLASKLSTAGGGLSVRIPESMRASSIKVNEISGVSGFILPGDRVDVLVTIDNFGHVGRSVTKTILQNVEVLAAGVKTETKKDNTVKVQSVTILVDPKGAEDLALGIHQGTIHLVLRNPVDHEIVSVESTDTQKVIRGTVPARPAPPRRRAPARKEAPKVEAPPPPTTYTVIRGGEVKEQEFPAKEPSTAAP